MGLECIVKQLWMVLHKPDYDSNDYELPCGQATPSTFIWRCGLWWGCMWDGLLMEYQLIEWQDGSSEWLTTALCVGDSCSWLGVGRSMGGLYVRKYEYVQECASVRSIKRLRVVVIHNIHCVFFYLWFLGLRVINLSALKDSLTSLGRRPSASQLAVCIVTPLPYKPCTRHGKKPHSCLFELTFSSNCHSQFLCSQFRITITIFRQSVQWYSRSSQ